ncbi:MAG: hypothetical protein EPO07_08630 [Verrucomicrobia bacterium]|nr:MAG: hypothetical protein EPO07_08630 [Verrucomicrobiota bacterium]
MAKDETKAIAPEILKSDADSLAAIQDLSGYAPVNPDFALAKLTAAQTALGSAASDFAQAEADWQTARDQRVAAQWTFHNVMVGARQQVVAQYGDDSNEAQAVGLKKKSEYAKRARKPEPAK